ncbi:MAG: FliH/SctL family protein [Pseudomonadota bacterium]|nr:FliH/SctL family protein [Pseudomonadota bacterium]
MSKQSGYKNVPPPEGSKAGTGYGRFIPAEELGNGFSSWQPGSFGGTERRQSPRDAAPSAPEAPRDLTVAEWQARVTAARQAGYQEGYRDGLVALESFKQSFAQQATAQIGALLNGFDAQLNALDSEIAQSLARTAAMLGRQVLRCELQQRPELVATVAAEAVEAILFSARHISVQVHPHDLPLVAEGAEEALAARGARLVPNDTIERGGVLVHSEVGAVDARIESRWALAVAALGVDLPFAAPGTAAGDAAVAP